MLTRIRSFAIPTLLMVGAALLFAGCPGKTGMEGDTMSQTQRMERSPNRGTRIPTLPPAPATSQPTSADRGGHT